MTRESVLGDVRAALGRSAPGSPPRWDGVAFPAREPDADPVGRFRAELELVAGECHGPTSDWRAVLRRCATEWGCTAFFPAPGIDLGPGFDVVGRDVAAARPEKVVGVARAEWGIAESGSVVVEADGHHLPSALTLASVILLDAARIVPGLEDVPAISPAVRCRVIVTGPARTADIEKRIVLGAHGPRWFAVVLGAGLPPG